MCIFWCTIFLVLPEVNSSSLDIDIDKRHHIFFATTDTCGNISNDYNKLIKLVARIQHPGVGIEGKYDVDGLRSQAVAFARRTVGAGVWRANYMTISAWASRTYGAVAVA